METVGEEEMIKHIEASEISAKGQTTTSYRLEDLFESLLELITDVPLWQVHENVYITSHFR